MREVSAYVTQQFNRYVMGVESLDTFDQFYRQLKEMGIETVLENHQEAYDLMYQNKINLHFASVPGVYALAKSASFHLNTHPPTFFRTWGWLSCAEPFWGARGWLHAIL